MFSKVFFTFAKWFKFNIKKDNAHNSFALTTVTNAFYPPLRGQINPEALNKSEDFIRAVDKDSLFWRQVD